jgi:RHS repeat-associated protein
MTGQQRSACVFFGSRLAVYDNWLNRDPLGEYGGINLYGFVKNTPMGMVDSDGRSWWPSTGTSTRI